jgi:L,D-peptidoglycan transpeptidase YkuD (ErfK/YbiS/YcfS/YnhG family)
LAVVATLGAAPVANAADMREMPVNAPAQRERVLLPDAIGAGAAIHQMVTVSARGWSSPTATLKAWSRLDDGSWTLVHGPVAVKIGYGGWVIAADRQQSTGTTPAGRFRVPFAFGRWASPGTDLNYRRVDGNDWWPYEPRDPATYNIYQAHKAKSSHWRAEKSEHLNAYRHQYGYAIVVGFNLPSGIHYSPQRHQMVATNQADRHRGGGIFLHVQDDGPTAGCVSMRAAEMRWLLRWVDPSQRPRLVMGPHDYIVNL